MPYSVMEGKLWSIICREGKGKYRYDWTMARRGIESLVGGLIRMFVLNNLWQLNGMEHLFWQLEYAGKMTALD